MIKFKIPIIDLKREYQFFKKDIQKQLNDCFKSQQWILGQKVIEFERKVKQYLGSKYTIGVGSGTDALILSLRALATKLKKKNFFDKKDEIITTPFTFIATAESIKESGATPVFVDINPDTFNIDPSQIKKAITKNTVGILPVHLYGLAADMDKILKIAKEHNLFVVEDTAQGFGGLYASKKLGTWGDCGAFSFFPSKNLGGYGDGGLIATDDFRLAELVRILRNHGQKIKYSAEILGRNSRLDSFQAAVLLAKLGCIDKFIKLRRLAAQRYNKALKAIKKVKIPLEPEGVLHAYHLYTIKVPAKTRNKLLSHLNSKGIESRIYYPKSLNKMRAFKEAKVKGSLKNTKATILKALSLPISPFLKESQTQYIARQIFNFFYC